MEDSPEMIRQQLNATKLQLSEKLDSLEHQVSETVQATGATVETIHDTVESVTGVVHGAIQYFNHAFDVRRQVSRYPLAAIGGATVLGYVLAKTLARSTGTANDLNPSTKPFHGTTNSNRRDPLPAADLDVITAAYEAGARNSSWHQLEVAMLSALVEVARNVATTAIPDVINYLTQKQPSQTEGPDDVTGNEYISPQIGEQSP